MGAGAPARRVGTFRRVYDAMLHLTPLSWILYSGHYAVFVGLGPRVEHDVNEPVFDDCGDVDEGVKCAN